MTDRKKKLIDFVKECKELGIYPSEDLAAELKREGLWDFPKFKVYFKKEELASMTKEELQEKLNKLTEAGFIPSDTTIEDVKSTEELNHIRTDYIMEQRSK